MITFSGPGALYAIPASGSPCNFGRITSMDLSLSRTVKPITGGQVWPIDFGGGAIKGTAKAKMAALSSVAIAALFFGITPATGELMTQYLEAGTVAAATPYDYTVTNPTGFVGPYEVLDVLTGLPYQQVTGTPTGMQYSVGAGGVLTFPATAEGKAILVTYGYTVATGYSLAISNGLQGDVPIFGAAFYNKKNGKPVTITLPMLTSEKLDLSFKEDSPLVPELDLLIGANAAGQAMTFNFPELS